MSRIAGELVAIAHDEGMADAYENAAAWLLDKANKARLYPGGDLVRASVRANAYRNAASEMRSRARRVREALEEHADA